MDMQDLKTMFFYRRRYAAESVNELMDFAKQAYISDEITIKEYRELAETLEAHGAVTPESLTESPLGNDPFFQNKQS